MALLVAEVADANCTSQTEPEHSLQGVLRLAWWQRIQYRGGLCSFLMFVAAVRCLPWAELARGEKKTPQCCIPFRQNVLHQASACYWMLWWGCNTFLTRQVIKNKFLLTMLMWYLWLLVTSANATEYWYSGGCSVSSVTTAVLWVLISINHNDSYSLALVGTNPT